MPKTKAQIRANEKYLEGFEMISFRVKKGEKEKILSHASSKGESMNAFINRAIEEAIKNDICNQ
jgi:predicted HicB family RNase H-like nuclease